MIGPPMVERAGRYILVDEIGSGGMASVHLGRLVGPAGFGRTVAIKRLHPHLREQPEFVAMLLDEARIASRIYHPNVVQVLDVITEGNLLLVLEYVHGESLARLAKRQRSRGEALDPALAVAIIIGVLRGLHAAHEMTLEDSNEPLGIVHRDVSPHNVLISTDGTAKILDFGIAKAQNRIQTTRDGQLKGKLAYMAPEQLENRPLDRRADIYAASVVLWELLTGDRLFMAETDGAIVTSILRASIPLPSTRVAAGTIPAALEALVMQGLAFEPGDRFESAHAMANALETECGIVPAPAARVAEWVQRDWPGSETRVRRLSEIERIKAIDVDNATESEDTESAVHVSVPKQRVATAVVSSSRKVDTTTPTRAESPASRVVADEIESNAFIKPRIERRTLVLWALGAAIVGVLLFFGGWRRFGDGTPREPPYSEEAGIFSLVVPSNSAAASASTSAIEPPPPVISSAPMKVVPVIAARPTAVAAATTATATATAKLDCDPPWTLNSAGDHVWKRECFRTNADAGVER